MAGRGSVRTVAGEMSPRAGVDLPYLWLLRRTHRNTAAVAGPVSLPQGGTAMNQARSVAGAAAIIAAALLAVLAAFQLALALGVPWGRASFGGADARLPDHLRLASAGAVVFLSLVILVVLRRGGHQVWTPLPTAWLPAAVWVLIGLVALSCVSNAITPSTIERAIWLPVSVALLAALLVVQLTADRYAPSLT